ncbi:DUF4097 family beta strand repeat-containing protein [Arsenicibacter rosenii]|uniref:DUF4097 domain-containing protein n=1 Tax=Arsenicibacter rosenii TaxID=1750698 RepID=A0A1S2VL74_9BACT|nr:DUF4097 family beta strand repeat-containing protein [Arsenicibacter rosenii]OIN58956.1 hypothetical protein BLX24_12115 [Arsenicibacter rosenii]
MKKLMLLSTALLWCTGTLLAQDYKTKLGKDQKVWIEMDFSNVRIEGHNGDDVIISGGKTETPPERAKGLKPLYNSAVDNTGLGVAVTQENGNLKIEKASRSSNAITIRIPKKAAVMYEQMSWMGGSNITVNNFDGDLEIKTKNGNIELSNVTGPVVANTTSGEIVVVYSALNQEKPSALSTISGEIDVTLPANTKSNLKLRSINGEMYTDFDLGLKNNVKDGLPKVAGGNNINGAINGGGVEIQLKTISSNIYVRKQK